MLKEKEKYCDQVREMCRADRELGGLPVLSKSGGVRKRYEASACEIKLGLTG